MQGNRNDPLKVYLILHNQQWNKEKRSDKLEMFGYGLSLLVLDDLTQIPSHIFEQYHGRIPAWATSN